MRNIELSRRDSSQFNCETSCTIFSNDSLNTETLSTYERYKIARNYSVNNIDELVTEGQ